MAFLFVPMLAGTVVIGACVLAYMGRCVLVVVQETASGQDEVVWPVESYLDWIDHAVLLFELLGIWVAPAALAARLLRHDWLPDQGALRLLLLAGPAVWLFFPVALLSSLSAESRWTPFRWAIVVRLFRAAPAAMTFYLLTAAVGAAVAAVWYFALFGGGPWLVPVAAAAGGAGLLVYARLLGRLAWVLQRLPSTERTPARPKPKVVKPTKPAGKKKRKPAVEVQDPWAVPEEDQEKARRKARKHFPWAEDKPEEKKPRPWYEPPSPDEIEGYGVSQGKAPEPPAEPPPRSRLATPPEEYEPIEVQGGAGDEPPAPPREAQSDLFAEQVRRHLAERQRTSPTVPPRPFLSGVWSFPWYRHTLPYWLILSLALLMMSGLVNLLIGMVP